MGYGYLFRIAVEDLENIRGFNENILPIMRNVHSNLSKREWFPIFGEADDSSSLGYGTGETNSVKTDMIPGLNPDLPLSEILLFTSQFPQLTFVVFFFHLDYMNLIIYRIQGNTLLNRWHVNTESLPFGKINLTLYMNDINIDNDISDMLSTN